MTQLQVLLADDHVEVAHHLRRLLEGDCELVATVGDGPSLMAAAVALRPDIIVADVCMPKFGGLEAARRLRAGGVAAKVILITTDADWDLWEEALAAGVSGCVIKHRAGEELLHAIREVAHGHTYVSPDLHRP